MSNQAEAKVTAEGSVVIPASLCHAVGLGSGDVVVMRKDGERLVLEKSDNLKRRLRARYGAVPQGTSLAAELLAERRRQARVGEAP